MKVLVADDSKVMRRIIKGYLKDLNLTDVIEAGDGKEAFENIKGIDLLITDWNMPVMNGLTLVKEVRAKPENSVLKILMITTESGKEDIIQAMQSGVNNYIIKPFTFELFKEKVNSLVKI
ncbi:MAG: hypothetical protein ACD_79C00554G0002 [uncultured bacterium]|nr:MAG: hypothetical protein ACD_79C00554G0002 [uncultured bacterium]